MTLGGLKPQDFPPGLQGGLEHDDEGHRLGDTIVHARDPLDRPLALLDWRSKADAYHARSETTSPPIRSESRWCAQACIIFRRAGKCSAWL